MKRRGLLGGVVAVILVAGGVVAPSGSQSPADAALPGFPDFRLESLLVDPLNDPLVHNPTGEMIFPNLFHASEHLTSPLAEWYMYAAAHDAPGGISLFYADDVRGPWIEYAGNPIIENVWSPNYSVSHVSSPFPIWNDEEDQLFLYFHGENPVTRYATSADGVTFTYGGVAISASTLGPNFTEASYARVFRYTIPRYDNVYTMTFMSNTTANVRKMQLAVSDDGRNWTVQTAPIVSPIASEGANVSSGTYWFFNGHHYVVYAATSGNVHITEVGADFDQETHLGALYDPASSSPEVNKTGAMTFVEQDGEQYVIVDIGGRLDGRIALYRDYTGEVYVPNQGFELNGSAAAAPLRWSEWNHVAAAGASKVSAAPGGKFFLRHSSSSAYRVSTFQTVTGIPNGTYTLTATARASAGSGTVQLQAKEYGTGVPELSANVPKTGAWGTVSVTGVTVTNGQIKIVLYSDRPGGTSVDWDDIAIVAE